MPITKKFASSGTGSIVPSYEPESRTLSNNGQFAPSMPGFYLSGEAWEPLTLSAARYVPSEDLQLTYLSFTVLAAAGSDDSCHVGILDSYGDVLWDSGPQLGLLNSVGQRFVATPADASLATGTYATAGKPFYLVFSYGAVGSTPAELLCATYGGAPLFEAYGTSTEAFGFIDTAIWTTVDGSLTTPPVGYSSPGQAVAMMARTW